MSMKYRTLGSSGTVVSALALGTMTFGAEADESASHGILDAYAAAGGTLIDTADIYARGMSEEIVGRWLASRPTDRDQMVVTTKGRFPTGEGPNDSGTSHRHLRRALDASLRRLGLEHIDLYQLHAWDPLTPLEESLQFLDDAIRAGKISYYGLSNFIGWQLTKAAQLAKAHGWRTPVTIQAQYSLLEREAESEIVPAALDAGMGLLPWAPLAGGWLTGKYERGILPAGASRLGENPQRLHQGWELRGGNEQTWDVLDAVAVTARDRGVSGSQVALAWLRSRPAVTSVILGARTVDQLLDNLASAELTLTQAELERLTAASAPRVANYPYGPGGVRQRSRSLLSPPPP